MSGELKCNIPQTYSQEKHHKYHLDLKTEMVVDLYISFLR